jgi:prophage maintenance system killer protein
MKDRDGADMGGIVLFQDKSGKLTLTVKLDNETVWLTQQQMADLFGVDRTSIVKHLQSIYDDGELSKDSTCEVFSQVRKEGTREVSRDVPHYNLDAIISVGYRVNSKQAVIFRQWATKVLREHVVKGVTLNPDRLAFIGAREAQKTLTMLAGALAGRPELSSESRQIVQLITEYAKTWTTLFQYDEGTLQIPSGRSPVGRLDYAGATHDIQQLKQALVDKGEAGPLFGQERGKAFEAILGNIEQEVFGEPCYKSVEEKAAHLLYFIIKDHPFFDGNKRIGSFMFLRYLEIQGLSHDFGPGALPALALLVAESSPENKDTMIRITINAITEADRMSQSDKEDVRSNLDLPGPSESS